MDIVTIHRDFTDWIAHKMNLDIDSNIFRGNLPQNIEYGAAVIFNSEIPVSGFYGFRPRTWNVQILAKFFDPDNAFIFQTALLGLFPRPGFVHGNTTFRTIEVSSAADPYVADDNGKEKTFVSINLVVSVLTTGAQTVANITKGE